MPHQLQVLKDQTRFKTLVWHRRARKTSTALEKVALEAFNPHLKNKVYWVVFPTYAEAKDAVWKDPNMLFRVIPKELVARQNEVELTLYLHGGSVICLKGADHPDTLRGSGPYGVVLDEFATMKYEAWGIIEPVLRANGGWAWFIGTPKGKNHLYDLYNKGQGNNSEWKSWLLKASTSGIVSPEQLQEARLSMRQDLYNQEWECEFLEGAAQVFRGVRGVMDAKPQKPLEGHLYVMGVDLAKVKDYTALAVYDRSTNCQVYQDRFQTIEWPFQKAKIKEIAQHFNHALIMLDATGLGDPIADDLIRAGVAVEPVKITEQTKKDLIEKLSIWIEQKKFKMLNLEESRFEFDNFSYEVGPTGKIRYGAPEGYHDDIVIAHALAVWSLQPLIKVKSTEDSLIRREYLRRLGRISSDEERFAEQEWAES
ncbi:MAG: terminase family protein [Candidatus Bipolaricaulis sp.]|nr:terminase family protein [Candidatus Bipolaricaulis sp.]